MTKGILKKKVAKYALIIGSFALYFAGGIVMIQCKSIIDVNEDKKKDFISNYKISKEYRDIIDEKVEAYYSAYQSGAFSQQEYNEKILALSSDEFAEKCILQGNDTKNIEKIKSYNQMIEKSTVVLPTQIATMVAGVAGIAGGILMKEN